ncbi:ActS/PrrB/RegB family redox-sensitive histidine kinase [Alkalicaulis satelles]|uniref:histidine kinase n=1 Tax=Alkalicaulis satelles TaxID=2609175 RepID=A0A5M6ZH75_9PROT|nr:ActS/PrrB/RegB family redox-sensitive histidine kinase [Alkalicaulis satelles]KAA5804089.1 ActS/PrrB/RegB family redox-sensitive histidine kinase [Alkalicaulis satelles]
MNAVPTAPAARPPGPDDWLDGVDLAPVFGRVRLRTLIFLRWLAVAGQTATVLGVHYGLGFDLPLAACLALIAASAGLNAVLPVFVSTQRLARDGEAFAQLAWDMVQLMALLALTGGLANPFAVMIVGPVVISVAALPARWWLALGAVAITGAAVIGVWHMPMPWLPGEVFALPSLYLAATGLALAIAIAFTAVYAWRVAAEARRMGAALAATQSVLAREQRLSALGALAAAAAHELGTPLATIQLTAKEMLRAAEDPLLKEDAELLVSQARRCREILQRLSQMKEPGDRMHDRLGLAEAMEEAAAPLRGVGAPVSVQLDPPPGEPGAPVLQRRAEILYALGNFIENAVDFANARVTLTGAWDARQVRFIVADDGPGFPPDILAKLGEPYVTTRQAEPGHGGLGLGVFIAMTLVERVGGVVALSNAPGGGARVEIALPRAGLEASA